MNLETLRLYCDVVRLRSFSRGAAERGVSQSAASQAIHQMEEEFAVRLLDRSKRPFAVTAEGEKVYEAGREILERFERVRTEVRADPLDVAGTVRVAAIYSVGLHGVSDPMQRFRSLHPRARVRLECLHPQQVVEAVVNDEADFGILAYPRSTRALAMVPLRSEPMVFVAPQRHPLARRKIVAPADLSGLPFIAFDRDLAIRKAIDRALKRNGVHPTVVMEFDNVETIKQAILIGTGVSLLPAPTVEKEAEIGMLAAVPFDMADLVRPIGVLRRRRKPVTPAAARFLELLRESAGDSGRGLFPRRPPLPPGSG